MPANIANEDAITLKLYPRGWLGKPLHNTIKPPDIETRQRLQIPYTRDNLLVDMNDLNVSNPDVDTLWETYHANRKVIDTMPFNIDVASTFIRAFGVNSLRTWIRATQTAVGITDHSLEVLQTLFSIEDVGYLDIVSKLSAYNTIYTPFVISERDGIYQSKKVDDFLAKFKDFSPRQLLTVISTHRPTGRGLDLELIALKYFFGSISK